MCKMNTFSGKKIDPLKMTSEDICLEDIAHALSLLCRGGGHLTHFYSVAQHSLNCAKEAEARGWTKRLQLICLLHDASEAYLSDIIRPVKVHLANYLKIEGMIMGKILEKFGLYDLTEEENKKWKQIDDEILNYELKYCMAGEGSRNTQRLFSTPDITEKRWETIEAEFCQVANCLLIQ